MSDDECRLKISDVSRMSGVSVATIHFYMREGLLPRPTVKTSRNMAYYDESFVSRIRFIRKLQEERRLPLRVIHSLLSGGASNDESVYPNLMELEALTLAALQLEPQGQVSTDQELIARTGIHPLDLAELTELGIVSPSSPGNKDGRPLFHATDVSIIEVVAHARALGLTRELFPIGDLKLYQNAISTLVGEEVALFAKRVRGAQFSLPPKQVLEGAVALMGQFVTQLRRKLIVDLMTGFGANRPQEEEKQTEPKVERTKKKRKTDAR